MDNNGYIVNDCAKHHMTGLWLQAVNDLISSYITIHGSNLQSIYIRGSVPRGNMIELISDIDSFCLIKNESKCQLEDAHKKHKMALELKHASVNGIEFESYLKDKALKSNSMRFLLKTQCLCLWGEDDSTGINPMTISEQSMNTCLYLPEINAEFRQMSQGTHSLHESTALCSWIFKYALRAAFEIVMMREKRFTRDLYFCWLSYSRYYPENSNAIKQALNLVINPVSDVARVKEHWTQVFEILQLHIRRNEHFLSQ